MANWKAPGPDGVHGYWIEIPVSMQERTAFHLQSYIGRGEVPDWMTSGRTVLSIENQEQTKQSA